MSLRGDGLSLHLRSFAAAAAQDQQLAELLDQFLSTADENRALRLWFGDRCSPASLKQLQTMREWLTNDIARIDALLNSQLNVILHHPRLKRLESCWRGLTYLMQRKPSENDILVRVLNVSWQELAIDAEGALEFDQSQLFRKVYEEEFGMPGGKPFGLLLADYEIRHRVTAADPVDDVRTLTHLSQVAAAAFAPVIVSAHPRLFGVDNFEDLDHRVDLDRTFAQTEYLRWKSFRQTEDARFVGVTVPRVLMRRPYVNYVARKDQFPFQEDIAGPGNEQYLWGSAIYAFGAVAMRAFATGGWLDQMIGVRRDVAAAGLITGLPVHEFATDHRGVATKFSTEVLLEANIERSLSAWGFIPVCHCKYTEYAAFYSCPALQRPARYQQAAASRNAELSANLSLMMCVSRFAHYLKVIVRDRVGSFASANQLEEKLNRWIQRYVSADPEMSEAMRPRFPLREASVQVRDLPGRPGVCLCIVRLRPHRQGEVAAASAKLIAELPIGPNRAAEGLIHAV